LKCTRAGNFSITRTNRAPASKFSNNNFDFYLFYLRQASLKRPVAT